MVASQGHQLPPPIRAKTPGHAYACELHQCAGEFPANESTGLRPPCRRLQVMPHKYCEQHLCILCLANEETNNLPRCEGSDLCIVHKCHAQFCPRMKEYGAYCSNHCCRRCQVETETESGQAAFQAAVLGSKYCEFHKCGEADCPALRCGRIYPFCKLHTCKVEYINVALPPICPKTRRFTYPLLSIQNTPYNMPSPHPPFPYSLPHL